MPKTCKLCTYPIFSKGLCLRHDREVNREKYQIKKKMPTQGLKPPNQPNFRHTKIKQVSDKQKVRLAEYKKVRDQFMLAHPVCQFKGCSREATDLHHMKPRAYYLCDVSVFMSVCREHHRYIHDHDVEARSLGYLINSI